MEQSEPYYHAGQADALVNDVPEIHRAESRLAESVGALFMELEALEKRLERVLRPEMEFAVDPTEEMIKAVREPTTQLTDFLHAQANRIDSETVRLRNILGRLGL